MTPQARGLGAVMSALELQGCVPNSEAFECRVCFLDVEPGQGVVLRDCLHTFCKSAHSFSGFKGPVILWVNCRLLNPS